MTGIDAATATPIPARLNLTLALLASAVAAALLWAAAHSASWWQVALCAVAFSFVGNTLFSLMHEAVHRCLHPRPLVNELVGVLCAAWFPTSLRFHRATHLGHHRRNRSDVECFDAWREGDNRALKWIQLYVILTGLYYPSVPLGCLLVLCCPWLLRARVLRGDSRAVQQMSGDAMLTDIEAAWGRRMAAEILFAIAFQVALVLVLDLSWWSWLACYGAFALNWSSLQYADHAFSVRHVRDGAWNLKVSAPVRWCFLNYHHHLAHHQHPGVPWIHLGRFVDPATPRPSFWRIYLRMWLGPVRSDAPPPEQDQDLRDELALQA